LIILKLTFTTSLVEARSQVALTLREWRALPRCRRAASQTHVEAAQKR